MDEMTMINTLSQVWQMPRHLLGRVVQQQYDFVIGLEPQECTTDDDPPRRLNPSAELIPVDEYLGLYELEPRRITVFNQGIRDASKLLECNPEHLTYVVRLHEYAHAFTHLSLTTAERHEHLNRPQASDTFMRCTLAFRAIENELHETLAQLLTLTALNLSKNAATIPEARLATQAMVDTFQALAKRQPHEYRIDDFANVPDARISSGFALLKSQWLVGKLEAWRTVMTW